MCAQNLFHNLVRSFRNYLSRISSFGVVFKWVHCYSNWSNRSYLDRNKTFGLCPRIREEIFWILVAAALQCERKVDLAGESRGIFFHPFTILRIYGQNGLRLISRYIFNLDFYHITVCSVIRVYIHLKYGTRKRRNRSLPLKSLHLALKKPV